MLSCVQSGGDYIILFDGVCNLCTSSVQFIIRHDKREVFKFASIQSPLGKQLLRLSHLDPENVDSFALVTPSGTLTKSEAALEIARLFGGIWHVCRALRLLPKRLRDSAYLFIAARRFSWFGRRDRCFVPSDELRKRFLD